MLTVFSFLFFWAFAVPPCAARLARTVSDEKVGEPLRLWVERRHPQTMLDYLVHCPVCLSYWSSANLTALAAALAGPSLARGLTALGYASPGWNAALFLFVCWGMSAELAIRFWLGGEE